MGTVEGDAPPSAGLCAEVVVGRAVRRSADTALGMRARGTLALEGGVGGAEAEEDIVVSKEHGGAMRPWRLRRFRGALRVNTPGLYGAWGQSA